MKNFKLTVLLLITCLNLYCQTDNKKVQVIDIPKTHMDIYYVNHTPKIVNGKLYTGVDTSYFLDDKEKLLAIETFKDGFKIELKTFYNNNNPECHQQWKNGKRDGISRRWYKNGRIMFDDIMKDGEDVGVIISFYENGTPQVIDDKQKSGVHMNFYENGKIKSLWKYFNDSTKCRDKEAFEETQWHENGQLMLKRIENCGKQLFKGYYNDTTIASEGTEIGMSLFLVGKYTEWYSNGKLKLEAYYQDGNTQAEANIKTGVWKYYNEKGLVKQETYENNQLINVKPYIKEKLKN